MEKIVLNERLATKARSLFLQGGGGDFINEDDWASFH